MKYNGTYKNGIPSIGLGCWKSYGSDAYNAVRYALDCGYKLIDTASRYENEHEVGKAIKDSGISREDVYVTSKLWQTSFDAPQKGIEHSLKQLDCEYIDLYLLHWPGTDENLMLKAFEAIIKRKEKGDIKEIGVSNFLVQHLNALIKQFGIIPAVDQIELHPWQQQNEVCSFCSANNIAVEAWGPILRGHISEEPTLVELAQKYGKSPAQITLKWHIQQDRIAIPKSVHKERIEENIDVFDFALSKEDMQIINLLDRKKGFSNDPMTYAGSDFHI